MIQKLQDNNKQSNIHVIGVTEGQEKNNMSEEILDDMLDQNF